MSRIIFPDFLTISYSLFVFSVNGPKQNARSLLTPVSDPTFYALSHGSKHFLLHGSSNNRLFQRFWLAVEEFWPIRKWLKKLPWRAKLRLPCERAWKAGSETGVKSDLAFCLGSLFKKTNSAISLQAFCQFTTCFWPPLAIILDNNGLQLWPVKINKPEMWKV